MTFILMIGNASCLLCRCCSWFQNCSEVSLRNVSLFVETASPHADLINRQRMQGRLDACRRPAKRLFHRKPPAWCRNYTAKFVLHCPCPKLMPAKIARKLFNKIFQDHHIARILRALRGSIAQALVISIFSKLLLCCCHWIHNPKFLPCIELAKI